jgi:hypothetical protein
MNEFKADFGFEPPHRTKKECARPEFSDHNLHRVAVMKKEHFGNNGDRDGGLPGWTTKLVCVGCGREFKHNFFYPEKSVSPHTKQ